MQIYLQFSERKYLRRSQSNKNFFTLCYKSAENVVFRKCKGAKRISHRSHRSHRFIIVPLKWQKWQKLTMRHVSLCAKHCENQLSAISAISAGHKKKFVLWEIEKYVLMFLCLKPVLMSSIHVQNSFSPVCSISP
jgi:hypothetical protein